MCDNFGQKIRSLLCYNHSGIDVPDFHSDDLYMVSQKAFLNRGLKSNYELAEFVRLIGHMCFNNLSYSRMVSKTALKGLNKASADETFSFITLIAHLITIPDVYM